jgi:phage FluMu gp28-like protein
MAHDQILFEYQKRWVEDHNRLKLAVKSTQIGFSFTESYADVLRCLERDNSMRAVLSRSERQSLEFARKCKDHCQAIGAVAQLIENESFQNTSMLQHTIEFPNRSRIIALSSNPDTARGYTCDITLDEFAFHKDSKAVFAAAYGRTTRGFDLAVISTPFGESGDFYKLAKKLGLADGIAPPVQPVRVGEWSGHWCDIYQAVREGLCNVDGTLLDVEKLLAGIDDPDTRDQEYLCKFLSDAQSWIALENILRVVSVDAEVIDIDPKMPLDEARDKVADAIRRHPCPRGARAFMGGDVGRKRDLTVNWPLFVFSSLGQHITPFIVRMRNRKFKEQKVVARQMIDGLRVARHCQDATGIGAQLGEELQEKYGVRVEPITFTMQVKEDLAVRTRRVFEEGTITIPDDKNVQGAIHAVKKFATTAGHFRFDAERTDAGHADEFWAVALALLAAQGAPCELGMRAPSDESAYQGSQGYQ